MTRHADDEPGHLAFAGDGEAECQADDAKTMQATGKENFCWIAITSGCGDAPVFTAHSLDA